MGRSKQIPGPPVPSLKRPESPKKAFILYLHEQGPNDGDFEVPPESDWSVYDKVVGN